MTEDARRCGYVALLGPPIAGKSTPLNALVGTKISIVTPKVQTTRARVIGIALKGSAQIVYVDTPGIFTPKRRLERAMVDAAWQGARDAEIIVLLVDAAEKRADDTAAIVAGLKAANRTAILALNKIDLVAPPTLLALADRLNREGVFTDIFMISALTRDGVSDLEAKIIALLPEGPWLYPEDQVTDIPLRQLAAEATREQLFLQLRQELPYALTVETESWEEREDGSVRIEQTIYVERESQKGIVLGQGGQRIKAVGAASRATLERFFDRRVHLFLVVKVRTGWHDDPARYRAMGLDFDV